MAHKGRQLIIRRLLSLMHTLDKLRMSWASWRDLHVERQLLDRIPERIESVNRVVLEHVSTKITLSLSLQWEKLTGSCSISKQYNIQAVAIQTLLKPTLNPGHTRRPSKKVLSVCDPRLGRYAICTYLYQMTNVPSMGSSGPRS